MKLRTVPLSAILMVSLISAPIAASAAPAARTASPVDGEQIGSGLAPAWIIAAVLVATLGVVIFSDDDSDDEPASP